MTAEDIEKRGVGRPKTSILKKRTFAAHPDLWKAFDKIVKSTKQTKVKVLERLIVDEVERRKR